ncbi:hypothetical protein [Vibrio splendidus]|uniref:hypothetical protein n=1 Tax=Vibrio splendidus TaxID=29497 RepID=UPI001E4322E2|nr:hypothetical protein [Vibrio splendidus]
MDTEIKVTELPDFNAFRVDAVLQNGHSVGYINISLKGTIADLCDLCLYFLASSEIEITRTRVLEVGY